MRVAKILLVAADPGMIDAVRRTVVEVDGLGLSVVGRLDEAYAYPGWDDVALVLIHHDRLCTTNGVARLLRMIVASRRSVATVVLADGLDDREASGLLRLGVADLLARPIDPGRLSYLVEALTLRARKPAVTRAEVANPAPPASPTWDESDPMVVQARRVAPQDATVLIHGEAGTGKSRLARMVHDLSPRRKGPFVTLRCGSVVPELFEDERLGPPEASAPRGGKLAEAREGTLLLDDVDALPPLAQVALLHWIEDDAFEAASSPSRPRPARPRLIATARSPLGEEAAEGRFRADLFYRLNVIGLALPPLRHRRLEIGSLAAELVAEVGGPAASIAPGALAAIEAHTWPGNIRELREALESALAAGCGPVVAREALPESVRFVGGWARPASPTSHPDEADAADEPGVTTLAQTKHEAEYARITQALDKHAHNRLRTANELGISRMTLYKKLYKYGIIEQEGLQGWTPGARRPRPSSRTDSFTGRRPT